MPKNGFRHHKNFKSLQCMKHNFSTPRYEKPQGKPAYLLQINVLHYFNKENILIYKHFVTEC